MAVFAQTAFLINLYKLIFGLILGEKFGFFFSKKLAKTVCIEGIFTDSSSYRSTFVFGCYHSVDDTQCEHDRVPLTAASQAKVRHVSIMPLIL